MKEQILKKMKKKLWSILFHQKSVFTHQRKIGKLFANICLYLVEKVNENVINCCCSLVVIKCGPVVEADKNFSSQVRLINLTNGSPYETLHAYVSHAVAPYFKSYVRATGKADR